MWGGGGGGGDEIGKENFFLFYNIRSVSDYITFGMCSNECILFFVFFATCVEYIRCIPSLSLSGY